MATPPTEERGASIEDALAPRTPPAPGAIARALLRALALRCPHCGGGPLTETWLRMRERCPRCGMRVERGEADYFLGSMMFNLVAAELLFVLALAVGIFATWPDVPWRWLQIGGGALMVGAPFALFPFTKTLWLAFDLMFRPVRPGETWIAPPDAADPPPRPR